MSAFDLGHTARCRCAGDHCIEDEPPPPPPPEPPRERWVRIEFGPLLRVVDRGGR